MDSREGLATPDKMQQQGLEPMDHLHCGEQCMQKVQDVEWALQLFDGMPQLVLEPN